MTLLGQMGNYNVTVIHHRLQAHTLVDGRFPDKVTLSLKQFGAVFLIKIIDRAKPELIGILHLDDLNLRQQRLLQHQKSSSVLL